VVGEERELIEMKINIHWCMRVQLVNRDTKLVPYSSGRNYEARMTTFLSFSHGRVDLRWLGVGIRCEIRIPFC
jgi:hypothetical protein